MKDFTFARSRLYHRMTANEMARDVQSLMAECPKLSFESLEVGQVVFYPPAYSGASHDVFCVLKVTPKRTQIEARRPIGDQHTFKAYKGSYHNSFTILDENLVSLLGITHREIVEEAVRLELPVPNEVRIYYPDMFVEVPERFAAERLIETMRPQWGRKVTDHEVKAFIEERHQRFRQLESQMSKAVALNPATAEDYERYLVGYIADIDFFRWLLPHVSEGGALHTCQTRPQRESD